MSFKAKLTLDGEDYILLQCSYSLYQLSDDTGRPSSVARGGTITCTVESTDSTVLLEYMVDNYMRKDGTITFEKRDEAAKMKELNFKEAYMIAFEESFDHHGPGAMIITFTLSARQIEMGSAVHVNEWPI